MGFSYVFILGKTSYARAYSKEARANISIIITCPLRLVSVKKKKKKLPKLLKQITRIQLVL